MRWAMTGVLPLPAPARTSTGPFAVVTASRWGGLSGARRLSAVTAGCDMGTNDNTGKRTTRGGACDRSFFSVSTRLAFGSPRQTTSRDARDAAGFTYVLLDGY